MKFNPGDLIRDIEGDRYKVVRVWDNGALIDIETTEGSPKVLTGVSAKFFAPANQKINS